MNEVVFELIKMLSETLPKTITFNKQIEENLPLISADRNQLHQTLLNLCINVRDAMPRGGVISFTTKVESESGKGTTFYIYLPV